jgi:hypothetical protein
VGPIKQPKDIDGSGLKYQPGCGETYSSESLDEACAVVSNNAGSGWRIFSTNFGKTFLIFSHK